jgi:hypothetical protein
MTRLQKLKLLSSEIEEIEFKNTLDFFNYTVLNKLKNFLPLTYFDTDNTVFENYVSTYRNELLIKAMSWCEQADFKNTEEQKRFMLKCCKSYATTMIGIIVTGFEDYVGNKILLLKEED